MVDPTGQGVPAGAVMLPPDGVQDGTPQVLLTMPTAGGAAVNTGHAGQTPGTVVTELVGLEVVGTSMQLHLVRMVWGGPDCAYVGKVVLQVPPLLVEYCKVEPVGQLPAGAEILPPEGVPPKTVHVLFTTTTAGAAAVNTGHPVLTIIKLASARQSGSPEQAA